MSGSEQWHGIRRIDDECDIVQQLFGGAISYPSTPKDHDTATMCKRFEDDVAEIPEAIE